MSVKVEPDKTDKDAVAMSCRAHPKTDIDGRDCPGMRAKIVFKKTLPMQAGGGTVARYRCLTCDGVWHIRL